MTINKTQENGTTILTLKGKLSTTTSQQFQEALIPAFYGAEQVILDFKEVDYVASAGLRVLFAGNEAAKSKNAVMILRGVSDEIMEIFEMTGFTKFLKFE